MEPLLAIEQLKLSFHGGAGIVPAVKGVDLTVMPGETVALVGESGCGKTALCRAILGLHRGHAIIEQGRILLNGRDVVPLTEREMEKVRGKEVSMIFQDPMASLNPVFSIGNQIMQPMVVHDTMTKGEAKQKALGLLQAVQIQEPASRFHQYPHHFSGGMRQRVAIAIALACNPTLIIADEPTTSLDQQTGMEIMSLLKDLCASTERGMIFVTHDLGLAFDFADRIAVMQDGVIVECNTAEEIREHPQHGYTKKLWGFAQYGKGSHYHGSKETEEIQERREPLVQVKALKKTFALGRKNSKTVLEDFNLTINTGEILGIVGNSGCGKSTLARCMMGIHQPDGGEIIYRDHCRKQMIFQDSASAFNPRMTIGQIIAEPIVIKNGKIQQEKVFDMMDQVGLERELVDRHPYDVSGGQRQRAAIARALITDPDFLIADEPISSLDVSIQSQIIHLLRKLHDERGLTMMIIGHDLAMIDHVSDRVVRM